jgi:hypothetical protein
MGADRIEGRDVQGIGYVIERIPGRQVFGGRIGVAAFHTPLAVLDANAARAAALLLLSAAGVDIVGAARKMVEAKADLAAADYATYEAFSASERMFAEIGVLAAELAKLEGGA